MLRSVALWLRPAGWPLLPEAARRQTLLLAWAAILAQAVFLGGWVLAGALELHYSHVRQYISELGRDGAANPWIFMTFMAIWGLGWIALAIGVACHRCVHGGGRWRCRCSSHWPACARFSSGRCGWTARRS